jgi:hypothetical protein
MFSDPTILIRAIFTVRYMVIILSPHCSFRFNTLLKKKNWMSWRVFREITSIYKALFKSKFVQNYDRVELLLRFMLMRELNLITEKCLKLFNIRLVSLFKISKILFLVIELILISLDVFGSNDYDLMVDFNMNLKYTTLNSIHDFYT